MMAPSSKEKQVADPHIVLCPFCQAASCVWRGSLGEVEASIPSMLGEGSQLPLAWLCLGLRAPHGAGPPPSAWRLVPTLLSLVIPWKLTAL